MTLFSIIIPVYNGALWINEALESILHQSLPDFEVIIVNDGSKDNSVELIEAFIDDHKELDIKLISQSNKGLGNARNKGANLAKGEWLAFLDADDYWSIHKLSHCKKAIDSSGCKWLYHSIFERYDNGRLRKRATAKVESIDSWLDAGNPIVPSATCIKKELFLKNNGFDEERDRVEDLGLWLRLFNQNMFPYFLDEALTGYRMGTGITNNMEDHYNKVMMVMNESFDNKILSAEQLEAFKVRKNYEFARQNHKMALYSEAYEGYAKSKKSLKVLIFKLLSKFRISI